MRTKDKLTLKNLLAAFAFSGMLWIGFIMFCLAIVEVAEGADDMPTYYVIPDINTDITIDVDALKECQEELASCLSMLDSIDESGFDNRTNK